MLSNSEPSSSASSRSNLKRVLDALKISKNNLLLFSRSTYSISRVILELCFIFELRDGVDEAWGADAEAELELELDVVEYVLFRSIPRRTTVNRSSRNFFEDASVKVVLSYLTSYSPIQFITLIIS